MHSSKYNALVKSLPGSSQLELLTIAVVTLQSLPEFHSIKISKFPSNSKANITCITTIYRSPSGNFTKFLKNLDSILNTWHSNKTDFVIRGDINIKCLENCKKRQQFDALLQTYNLIGTV